MNSQLAKTPSFGSLDWCTATVAMVESGQHHAAPLPADPAAPRHGAQQPSTAARVDAQLCMQHIASARRAA